VETGAGRAWQRVLSVQFTIEELADGHLTVFVPTGFTPLAAYVMVPELVHPLDVPFTDAIKTLPRWGAGSNSHRRNGEKKAA
jgi:hypothetical protein